jgi:hypothetical protein
MEMDTPKFTLNRLCPVCEQASSLLFLTCPACGKVILACDEDGSVFPDPKNLDQLASYPCDPWVSTISLCPHCGTIQEFRLSSGKEIQTMGFTPRDYT